MFGSEKIKQLEKRDEDRRASVEMLTETIRLQQKQLSGLIQLCDKQQAQIDDLYNKTGWPRG